jgi:hypothetical protein
MNVPLAELLDRLAQWTLWQRCSKTFATIRDYYARQPASSYTIGLAMVKWFAAATSIAKDQFLALSLFCSE